MKTFIWQTLILFLCLNGQVFAQKGAKPVTPNASPEAKALLGLIQNLSGKYTLPGQHNFPISGAKNSEFASEYIGKTPPVWSQDFGFSKEGDKDSYLARPAIIEEAIRQHKLGALVTLCWHAVPPTADEPITFQPLPGADSTALASVQGKLLDKQFEDILTPGTELHKRWLAQVDEISAHLKKLQEAGVPVLWRPYHEMNGAWFWWGGRHNGKFTTARLYQQIFDRMVHHHKLNNLVWMWSVDRPSSPDRDYKNYYPGNEYLDIAALDVYGSDFKQAYYDDLKSLANGKPLALGEVGVPPTVEVLINQPDWTFWVIWSGMARGTPKDQYAAYVENPTVIFMEDEEYGNFVAPLRKVSGLPAINQTEAADFSGMWVLNENKSDIQGRAGGTPYKINIIQVDNAFAMESFTQSEYEDDRVEKQLLKTDGSDIITTVFNSPKIQHASWSTNHSILTIESKVTFNFGGNPREMKGKDVWRLENKGRKLIINRKADSFRGNPTNSVLIYEKKAN